MSKRTKKTAGGGKQPLELKWIEAGTLTDNDKNWRIHPKGQVKALKAMLHDVGWAGALLYNQTTKRLIDGHLRKRSVDPKTPVPVLVGRWTPEQEARILATLDPLAAMATADAEALESLLAETDLPDGMDELTAMLDDLIDQAGKNDAPAAGDKDDKRKAAARSRAISELYAVIVECKNEREQLAFYRRMQKEGRKCKLHVL